MRRAARTDDNKAAIVKTLRDQGCSVYDLKQPVDLMVGANLQTVLVEIKDGNKSPSRQKYTPAQEAFMSTWQGGPVATIRDVDGALRLAAVLKGEVMEVHEGVEVIFPEGAK